MVKLLFIFTLATVSFSLLAGEKKDSIASPILLAGNVTITNNGISPVPAFSLGKPAVMTEFSLQKSRFSFTNQFNYGIDGRPWSSNNWFRIHFPGRKFSFQAGVNWSLFFKQSTISENNQTFVIKRVNRYLENEIAASYTLNRQVSIYATWWHDEGMDVDAVQRGDFYSLAGAISLFPASDKFGLKLRPNLFYLTNKIPFSGFFFSNKSILTYRKLPLSLSVQVVQPIAAEPGGAFSWNVGLNYSFNNE